MKCPSPDRVSTDAASSAAQEVTKELEWPVAQIVTPITSNDVALYREFFARDNRVACYGNSLTYINQACRGLGRGFKYYDRDVLLSIGHHRGHFVIVRPLGTIDSRFIKVLRVLHDISGKPVFIKKLFSDQATRLRSLGTFSEAASYCASESKAYAGVYPWDFVSFADDDTYPELILDLDLTLKYRMQPREWLNQFQKALIDPTEKQRVKSGQKYYQIFRRSIKQFLRLDSQCCLKEYNVGMAIEIRRFLLNHFGSKREDNVEAYEAMLSSSQVGTNGDDYFSLVAHVDGIESPVGFFYVGRLDEKSAGLYAGVVSRSCPGLPEYLGMQMMSRLQKAGITLLNLGGSEVKNLHVFKRKQAPVEERYMSMLAYGVD